ncbi:BTAD domain-containing putative transcriptional regulator [Streptomyces fragilis]|uniref:BTAD domain-containing putative transcriptional regulator n=1 Tax=Streptomyces fragilis TaxID=67301 RepID=A0ABV2YCX3_9ACTN|nr:BTAD domain-containing putative transcriptional regulator [Streptomyces fragilis]
MSASHVAFRLLGPLEVESDSCPVRLTPRQRALCAALLLQPGRVVSVDRLVDQLWGAAPPQAGEARVRALVAEVRRAMGACASVLETRRPGYAIRVTPDELDTLKFEELVGEGSRMSAAGEWRAALRCHGEALRLWRGEPLTDLPALATWAERERLSELRKTAQAGMAEAEMELGDHPSAVARLVRLTAEDPLRERPHVLLMRALQLDGRMGEALQVYAALRRRLVEELGTEPSAALTAAHQRLLAGEAEVARRPSPQEAEDERRKDAVVPRQLPAAPRLFVGRSAELSSLDDCLHKNEPLALITGPAGIGKSSLALKWANRVMPRFPDGQLFLPMHGFDGRAPMSAGEALVILLQGLGCAVRDIPTGQDAQAALYRTMIARRKMLLVLDDVTDAETVRRLQPPAPGSMTVVTSRYKLGSLITLEGARRITCDLFGEEEALELLRAGPSAMSVDEEPEASGRLVQLCERLPLALSIARSWLQEGGHGRVQEYIDELAERGRLAGLQSEGDDSVAVRAALDLSYETLLPEARRVFRLLGVTGGSGRSTAAIAATSDIDANRAEELLRQAEKVHLVRRDGRGRWAWHDLVHEYAVARSGTEDPADVRDAARHRLLGHYLHSLVAAAAVCSFHTPAVPLPPSDGAAPRAFRCMDEAAAWVDAEWKDIVSAVMHAADFGPAHYAWQIVDAMQDVFHHWRPLSDWIRLATISRSAADRDGDAVGVAAMSLALGAARWREGDLREAFAAFQRAEDRSKVARWGHGEAAGLQGAGVTLKILGEPRRALPRYRKAIDLYHQQGNRRSEGLMLLNMSSLNLSLGLLDEAEEAATRALDLLQADLRIPRCLALANLASVRLHQGSLTSVTEPLRESFAICRDADLPYAEAMTLDVLARFHAETGRDDIAWRVWHDALAVAEWAENRYCRANALLGLSLLALRWRSAEDARQYLQQADGLIDSGYHAGRVDALLQRALISHATGDALTATALLGQAGTMAIDAHVLRLPLIRAAEALTLLETGEPKAAFDAAQGGVDAARQASQRLVEARCLKILATAGEAAGILPAAEAAAGRATSLFDSLGIPAVHRDGAWWAAGDVTKRPVGALPHTVAKPPAEREERLRGFMADHFPEGWAS